MRSHRRIVVFLTGKNRRSLKYIRYYPRPLEIYERITTSKGWIYKTNRDFYVKRDRALVAITYLLAGRISEVLRLKVNQIEIGSSLIIVKGIKLSKASKAGKPRRDQYRHEAKLVLTGDRSNLTQLFLNYLTELPSDPETRIFPIGESRAWQIITTLTGDPPHWFRAYGENFLYDKWDHDLLAVADYVKVDPRTLQNYIRRSYEKYKPV